MNQNYGTPIPPLEEIPSQPKKKNTWLIILIVILVVVCCCCAIFGGGMYWLYNNGDKLLEDMDLSSLWLALSFI